MSKRACCRRGQAAVELLVALPLAAVVLACGWQLIVVGQAWWTVSEAARVSARTLRVETAGAGRDRAVTKAVRVAKSLLPSDLRSGSRVDASAGGRVRIRVHTPVIAPFSVVFGRGPSITARSRFGS